MKRLKNIFCYLLLLVVWTGCSDKLFTNYREDGKTLEKINISKLEEYASKENSVFNKTTQYSSRDGSTVSYILSSKDSAKTKISVQKKKGVYTFIKKIEVFEDRAIATMYNHDGSFKSQEVREKKDYHKDRFIPIPKIKIATDFEMENFEGSKTSLSNLKGSYVYINVWATWSRPSEKEILALNEMVEEFRDKNIFFVNISVDKTKDYSKWKKMVADKKLKGLQLFAYDGWKSKFIKDYEIYHIPRSILIDPSGFIINGDAPRPSSSELKEVLSVL